MQSAIRLFFALAILTSISLPFNSVLSQGNFSLETSCEHDATVSERFTGATEITTCGGDGISDRLRFSVSSLFMAFGYVVVDENDIIVSIGFSNFIDFEMLPTGVLRVYAFSSYGLITASVGDDFNTAELSVPCFDLTENFVTVNNLSVGGFSISTPSGETEFTTCPNDGNADIINFLDDGSLSNSAYLITDSDNVVLAINTDGAFDFDGAGSGICRVYALSYDGELPVEIGDDLDALELPQNCGGGLSENFLTVNRVGVLGGTVSTIDGDEMIMTCPGDGVDDIVAFANTGGTGTNFTYVVTDENNIILDLPTGDEINFENAPEGVCRVWGLSYEGNITATAGDDAAAVELADGCFDLSDNFVTVVREAAEGGTIATTQGATEVATCPGDSNADLISFVGAGAGGGAYSLVVTDTNNVIISLPAGNEVDFENAGVGICRVWGLSYQGDLLAALGDDAAATELASSCFDLSDNFVTVIRTVPNAGTVATTEGDTEITFCSQDELADVYTFVNEGADGSNFIFVITDADNVILSTSQDGEIDFSDAALGQCRVWGLSYEGNLLAMAGDDAAATMLADGCFALTNNFVTVNRIEAMGATVATIDGATEVTTCQGDGQSDEITFVSEGGSELQFTFVVTDAENNILGVPGGNIIDFENVAPGQCRVWGLTYSGVIIANPGDNAAEVQLATGCFALSENFVTVNRVEPEGGTVSTEDGEVSVTLCPSDAVADLVQFDSTGTSLSNFAYLITGEDDVILGVLPSSDQFNFGFVGAGVYRVYGYGYEGSSLAAPGDTVGIDPLGSSCFVLTDNFITVTSENPDGGTVSTEAGEVALTICPNDGISDVVAFDSSGVGGGQFVYVVTDENNVILGVPTGDEVDFEVAGFGTCRLWGLVFQGDLIAEVGDVATGQLATGCFSLSDNFVTVTREDVNGGTLATVTGGDTVFTCPGDGIADPVTVVVTGNSEAANYIYVITDEENNILNTATELPIDFETAGEGVCRLWGLSYVGDLLAEVGDNAATTQLASGCFGLSQNFITVVRTVPEGGLISTVDGENSVTVCSGDNSSDEVFWEATGNSNGGYVYIVTQGDIFLASFTETSFDFNAASSATYTVYGLAYAGQLTLVPGMNIFTEDLATSCFDLTDNSIEIVVEEVDACEISVVGSPLTDIVYLCSENPNDGFVEFFSCSTLSDTNYQYVITTSNDIIISLIDDSFDFGNLPLPEARVYAISYTGELAQLIGVNINTGVLSDGCYVATDNFVTILNGSPEGGEISLAPETPEPFCVANGNGLVNINTTSTSNTGYAILVTDLAGIIQQVNLSNTADFNDLPSGNYLIYGLSYTGIVTAQVGDDINLVALADNCSELAAEPIEFFRAEEIDGGVVTTQFDTDTFFACPGDGSNDILAVTTTITGVPYRYLVTDALGNIIIPESFSNIFNFEDADEGTYRVYGYAFSGQITATFGTNVETAQLSDSCFALSENFITVIAQTADGGTVATTAGDTTVTIDLGSDETTVTVASTDAADQIGFTYLITNEQNFVLGFGEGPTFDFADAPTGVGRIWGLSYQGELLVEIGDDAASSLLATSCYDLSDNFVQVTRTNGFQGGDDNTDAESTNETVDANAIVMTAFPNPVSGSQLNLMIDSETILEDGTAIVRDQNGRAWATQAVDGGSNQARINFDISNFPTGLFIVQYLAGDRQEVVRFLRQ